MMSFWFLVVAPVFFQAITDGHPLDFTDQLENTNSLGLWDNFDSSSEQLAAGGASGSDFLLDSSNNSGYDIFASDTSSNPNGIESNLELPGFSSDVGFISMDHTDDSSDFLVDAGGFGNVIAEDSGCTNQARKRDEFDNMLLGSFSHVKWILQMVSTDRPSDSCAMP